ncbi:MAG: nitronate monooxygenase [Proteobacteria bacterium]|nr:nitronate monooxygenase [Pseudomonadota bacterium]
MWKNTRFTDLVGVEHPLMLAPMAGPGTAALAIAVSEAGGLGGLPCAMLTPEQVEREFNLIINKTKKPINFNFFCHLPNVISEEADRQWRQRLAPYFAEYGLDPAAPSTAPSRNPFGEEMCRLMEAIRPKVVSFHFGLPDAALVARLKQAGCRILSSATTVAEARWLEARGADAIIAQGYEAGGHRGMFLSDDLATQVGTFSLVPQVADAVSVPVIAAGGIADGRGFAAALVLGASAVSVGTAYLFTPEAKVVAPYRAALAKAGETPTAITNIMTGRPARGLVNRFIRDVGPLSPDAPAFPHAAGAVAQVRAAAEAAGSGDFTASWAGQSAALARPTGAAELTRDLVRNCRSIMGVD